MRLNYGVVSVCSICFIGTFWAVNIYLIICLGNGSNWDLWHDAFGKIVNPHLPIKTI